MGTERENCMVCICGDLHGSQSKIMRFAREMRRYRGDPKYLVVCGDFGFVFRNDHVEHVFLDDISRQPETYLFVDGNHENFDYLQSLPVENWHGGRVHFLRRCHLPG